MVPRAVLDVIGRVHAPDDLATLQVAVAEGMERLLRGSVAAMFVTREDPRLVTLCAAGPGWRTAEREGPAWLAPLSGWMADLVRADARRQGRLVREPNEHGPDLAVVPLGADDERRHVLVVAWPVGASPCEADMATLDVVVTHVSNALRRVVMLEGWRHAADSMRAAQAELVASHAEQAAASVASGVAHDLNNSLSVLLGVSDYLLASDALDSQARTDVESIHGAALATARLAQRLTFISRNPRDAEPDFADLGETLSRAADRVRGERDAAGADVALKVDELREAVCVAAPAADLTDTITALLRLHAEGGGGARVKIERAGAEVAVVTEGPAVAGFGAEGGWSPNYTRATRWRGPILAACRRVAHAHGWRLTLEPTSAGRQRIALSLPVARMVSADGGH